MNDSSCCSNLIDYLKSDLHDRVIHKWSNYFDIYDRHFSKYRNCRVNVLEIGVGKGGSLQMWKWYFGADAKIYGVDIDESKCFEESQIKCYTADQSNRYEIYKVWKDIGCLDVVIDDGGHYMNQQKTSFDVLYPLLNLDGVYLVEDIHTSFWTEFGGGLTDGVCDEGTFMHYIKNHVEKLSSSHSRGRLDFDGFSMATNSIHFYNSVVVIEKGLNFMSHKVVG